MLTEETDFKRILAPHSKVGIDLENQRIFKNNSLLEANFDHHLLRAQTIYNISVIGSHSDRILRINLFPNKFLYFLITEIVE